MIISNESMKKKCECKLILSDTKERAITIGNCERSTSSFFSLFDLPSMLPVQQSHFYRHDFPNLVWIRFF